MKNRRAVPSWLERIILVCLLIATIDLLTGDRISKTFCDVVYVFNEPPKGSENKFAPVRQLTNAGLDTEARKKLSEIISTPTPGPTSTPSSTPTPSPTSTPNPTPTPSSTSTPNPVPEDLRYLSDKQLYCLNDDDQESYEKLQFWLTIAILCVLILRIIWTEAYNVISRKIPIRQISLEIGDFNDEAIELKIGKSIAATIKSSIAQYTSPGETSNIGSPKQVRMNCNGEQSTKWHRYDFQSS